MTASEKPIKNNKIHKQSWNNMDISICYSKRTKHFLFKLQQRIDVFSRITSWEICSYSNL